ncbi:MAG: hypothetical protein U0M42_07760 [Acutalibacteraceae bacterium]|nr:hypothetical protein [Acutalibacteraceae bacterium]
MMVGYRKQLKLLFIPILNCSIIFIIVFKNRNFLKNNWQLKLLPYLLVISSVYLLSSIINEKIFSLLYELFNQSLGFSWIISLIEFYPFSVIACSVLLLAQKRLIKLDYQKDFMKF